MRPPARLPRTCWTVRLARHAVDGHEIPATSCRLPAADADQALEFAIRQAHIAAGVPPSRQLLRESARHATVGKPTRRAL